MPLPLSNATASQRVTKQQLAAAPAQPLPVLDVRPAASTAAWASMRSCSPASGFGMIAAHGVHRPTADLAPRQLQPHVAHVRHRHRVNAHCRHTWCANTGVSRHVAAVDVAELRHLQADSTLLRMRLHTTALRPARTCRHCALAAPGACLPPPGRQPSVAACTRMTTPCMPPKRCTAALSHATI